MPEPGLRVVTSWRRLMALAHALGQAKKRGDPDEIRQAQAEHDGYLALVRTSDQMLLGRVGDLR